MSETAQSHTTHRMTGFDLKEFADRVDCEQALNVIGVALFEPPTAKGKEAFEPASFIEINSAADLVQVERIMLAMGCAGLVGSEVYWSLVVKAKAYFKLNPALLSQRWPHEGGDMYELHRELCRRAGIQPPRKMVHGAAVH